MRVGIVAALVAFSALFGATSHAGSLPGLPGMGVAEKALEGRGGSSQSFSGPAPSASSAPAPRGGTTSSSSVKPSAADSIMKLPGTGVIPAIAKATQAASHSRLPSTDVLAVLAAIGSATALGMLWAVRRRFGG